MKRKFLLAIPIVALLAALLYYYGGSQAPSNQAPLQKLTSQNLDEIKNAFNGAKDGARVLLLLSPT